MFMGRGSRADACGPISDIPCAYECCSLRHNTYGQHMCMKAIYSQVGTSPNGTHGSSINPRRANLAP